MKKPISLYIHIPFCVRKCGYCDFLSFSDCTDSLQKTYLKQLFREMDSYKEISKQYQVQTVFVGGGTPSILQEGCMEQLFSHLHSIWDVKEGAEITVESNPGTLTANKLIEYRMCGINRLSIGLQSADNEELKRLGRIHNYEQFIANYKLAREAGFRNINVDIMAALPGQTQSSFGKTLAKVVELKPEHISVYSLIVEEGTPLADNRELLDALPSETTERRMYKYTKSILNSMGYERYEISNYAKPGYSCQHNQVYWTGGEYLGFGLGAASYWNGMRFENMRGLQEYLSCPMEDVAALRRNEVRDTRKSKMEEFMFLGLRMMKGVSKSDFAQRFAITLDAVYGTVIWKYLEQGLLVWDGDYLQLTDAGIDVSNVILADFLLEEEDIN